LSSLEETKGGRKRGRRRKGGNGCAADLRGELKSLSTKKKKKKITHIGAHIAKWVKPKAKNKQEREEEKERKNGQPPRRVPSPTNWGGKKKEKGKEGKGGKEREFKNTRTNPFHDG